MARYSGDQIANSPQVVANYLRTAPTTRLATRQIQFFKIHSNSTDFSTGSELPNSNFSKAVRGIQAQAEVVIIGSPNGGAFVIGVYADTANDGNLSDPHEGQAYAYMNSFSRTLAESVNASVGISDADVDYQVIYGDHFQDYIRAINYSNPQTIDINGNYTADSVTHLPSYENELYKNDC